MVNVNRYSPSPYGGGPCDHCRFRVGATRQNSSVQQGLPPSFSGTGEAGIRTKT
uniref:Uncharacterized protein n=1 Tax=Escherichia coli TaxID=562 RepID=A0A075MH08_ECOLX|nr:hypothetical protein [Escherichia coli]AIF78501.1 hypothetical protein [Escherichia coli]AJM91004.1 hypothetical protein [Escherichia coli]AZQ22086.1 hypothetical protein [Escherichia coli]AZQ22233.1 hypothetical protein [Escherichia coli]